ncbi:MAG: ISNCY family transposase, partial [Streptococcaceae bacterium]|nr:ISNCY family transposase [Streptococcaceae bacterium]
STIEDDIYRLRKLEERELYSKEFDVQTEEKPREKVKYIPPMSHPWKRASFVRYLKKAGKTQKEFDAERIA